MGIENEIMTRAAEVESMAPPRRKWIWLALLGLLLFAAGAATGHFAGPAKVVTKTEVQTQTVTKTEVQYVDRVVTQKVYVRDKKQNQHTETTTTKEPDGTVITKTTTDTSTDTGTNVNTNTQQQVNQTQQQAQSQEKVVEKVKTVTNQPNWLVEGGVGVAIPYYLGQSSPGVPGLHGLVIDASISRRVVGPFYLGLGANTQGVLSLRLSGAF